GAWGAAGAAGAAAAGGGADAPEPDCAAGAADSAPVVASATSTVNNSEPSETLSPTLALSSFITPLMGAGTSRVALSDSSVTSESSGFTVSPGFTSTSMMGMFLKSPMAGTFTSMSLGILALG